MMGCDAAMDAIQEALEEADSPLDLASRLPLAVQRHLEDCRRCREAAHEFLALDGRLRLLRPFDRLEKGEVLRNGANLPLHLTFSCLNPVAGRHCGTCNKCAERRRGFRAAGWDDQTPYAASPATAL